MIINPLAAHFLGKRNIRVIPKGDDPENYKQDGITVIDHYHDDYRHACEVIHLLRLKDLKRDAMMARIRARYPDNDSSVASLFDQAKPSKPKQKNRYERLRDDLKAEMPCRHEYKAIAESAKGNSEVPF